MTFCQPHNTGAKSPAWGFSILCRTSKLGHQGQVRDLILRSMHLVEAGAGAQQRLVSHLDPCLTCRALYRTVTAGPGRSLFRLHDLFAECQSTALPVAISNEII